MKQELRGFAVRLAVITLVLAGIGSILFFTVLEKYYFDAFPLSFIVFFGVSFFSYLSMMKSFEKNLTRFNNSFMITFFIKIVIYTAFAVLVLLFSEDNKKAFAVCLLIQYVAYTIFDVRQMLASMRKHE